MKRLTVLSLCAAIGVALAGCNSQDASDLKRDVGKLADTGGRAINNAQLVARVEAALAQRKGVDMSGLHIEAKNGVVTLGGHVRSSEEKHLVQETTDGIRGVDKIVNNLRIEN